MIHFLNFLFNISYKMCSFSSLENATKHLLTKKKKGMYITTSHQLNYKLFRYDLMGWSQKVLRQIGIWCALIMKLKKITKIYLIFLLGG